jgi:hypothetical protein
MTRLLLDHPWPLNETLNARSNGFQVLLEFEKLVRRKRLIPLRFIEQHDYESAKQQLGKSPVAAQILRFSNHLIRYNESVIRATPDPEPNPTLNDSWKRALRDELEHLENWRSPQIIFPEVRRSVWSTTDEIEIKCGDRNGTVSRVLASLEKYDSHPFAVSDLDPWRHLERLFPPTPGHPNNKPCRLPKPPILDQVPVEHLSERLEEARKQGCIIDGKYYYIPSDDCLPEQIAKPEWRSGYVFDRKKDPGWKGPCPIDYNGVTWRWDQGHRHWDLQVKPKHISVSHTGEPD